MTRRFRIGWLALVALNLAGWCMLCLQGTGSAAPRESSEPFANSIEQRAEMIAQLQSISALLKEQNALLKSGRLTVIVAPPPQP